MLDDEMGVMELIGEMVKLVLLDEQIREMAEGEQVIMVRVVLVDRELLLSDIRFHSFQETHLKYLPFCIYFAPS